jgi:hypothetical protein
VVAPRGWVLPPATGTSLRYVEPAASFLLLALESQIDACSPVGSTLTHAHGFQVTRRSV